MIHSGNAISLLEQALAAAELGSILTLPNSDPPSATPVGCSGPVSAEGSTASWIETKEIHGHLYRYRRWRERGRLRSQYLGKAT
jgi:hypothetical protein